MASSVCSCWSAERLWRWRDGRDRRGLHQRHARKQSPMKRTGFYSGSFDPVTNGHTDVITRAARMVDTLVIGIGVHPGKTPMFTTEEKIAMLEAETAPIAKKTGCRLEIVTFSGLTVDAAQEVKASVIFRGLRDGTDLDYDMQMAGMNGAMAP